MENRKPNRLLSFFQFNLRDLALAVLLIGIGLCFLKTVSSRDARKTGRELDIAIHGRGYFQVIDEGSGQRYYTRVGSLSVSGEGLLHAVHSSARWQIDPTITVPQDWVQISINKDGQIAYSDGSRVLSQLGSMELARFINEEGLEEIYPDIYSETNDSGPPMLGTAGSDGFGFIRQGRLEQVGVRSVSPEMATVGIVLIVTAYLLFEIRVLGRRIDVVIEQQQRNS